MINIGVGKGVTVRELLDCFEKVYGKKVKKIEVLPRPGDVVGAYTKVIRKIAF